MGVPRGAFMHSREQLANDLRTLGIEGGDTMMLHASVRAVGEVAGGPDQIHLALKDVLTAQGTLIMYASCPRYYDEVGEALRNRQRQFVGSFSWVHNPRMLL